MRLVKRAWKLLVGVKDGLVLLFMLLFFGVLAAGLSARPGGRPIGDGALALELKGSIVEQPSRISPQQALTGGRQARQYRTRDLVTALDHARDDDRVKAVVLDLDGFLGGGQVALGDVGEALDRVRAKKRVLAFATGYSDDAYQIAAHASEIWIDPMGLALFAGPGGSQLYYKGLLDRVGANVHVYRVGKYKAAVEPFTRADSSPEAKAANEALAGSLWTNWQSGVVRARPKAQLAAYVADPATAAATGDLAQAALRAGLVDRVADKATFDRRVRELAGRGREEERFASIDLKRYVAARPRDQGDGAVGVVTVAGVISDGEAGPGSAGGDTIAGIIDRAVASEQYKALVVRVDSPGGSALASEKIRVALNGARAKKMPVVVSMGNVAASGGYWVATAGDRIFAEPSTITGSIGVFGIIPTFEASLAKVGVTSDGVRTTPLSGQPDIVGGTNAAFDTVIQRSIESTYGRFVNLVSQARKMSPARVDEIGQGRVWDGGTARQIGLVDQFGGVEDAVADAARRAGLDPAKSHAVWLEPRPGLREMLVEMFESEDVRSTDLLSTLARARIAELSSVVADAQLMFEGSAIQARCLECPAPTIAMVEPQSLLTLLRAWLAS